MLSKVEKHRVVEGLAERFKRQKTAIFSDFGGVSVAKISALRRLLKKSDAEYKVAKKTLFDRALEAAGLEVRTKDLKGEIGTAFGYGDEIAPAKILSKFGKENETFKILGGILSGRILADKEVLALARLPGREQLLAQLAGTLISPLRGLAAVLQGNMRNMVVVLNKIKSQKV